MDLIVKYIKVERHIFEWVSILVTYKRAEYYDCHVKSCACQQCEWNCRLYGQVYVQYRGAYAFNLMKLRSVAIIIR